MADSSVFPEGWPPPPGYRLRKIPRQAIDAFSGSIPAGARLAGAEYHQLRSRERQQLQLGKVDEGNPA